MGDEDEQMRFWKAAASLVLAAAALAVGVPSAEKGRAERRMALTIDDLPVAQPSWHDDREMERITTDLLATLVRHRVPAVGFVNEGKLEVGGVVDSFRLGLLERWLAAGLELGNRGFAHLDLHRGAGAGYIFVQLKRASRGKTPQLYKYVPGTNSCYKPSSCEWPKVASVPQDGHVIEREPIASTNRPRSRAAPLTASNRSMHGWQRAVTNPIGPSPGLIDLRRRIFTISICGSSIARCYLKNSHARRSTHQVRGGGER